MSPTKSKYYAYMLLATGEKAIVNSWAECEAAVKGREARFKGFTNHQEAESWLADGGRYTAKIKPKLEKGIYFDAGTGRGEGVEVSVTDEKGNDLLDRVLPKKDINKHGKYNVQGAEATNNYGELLGCKFALTLAIKEGVKKVFGDSKLVINYWSKGFIKNDVAQKTRELAYEVAVLREQFEEMDGKLSHVSGDHNPADLGFH